MSGLPDLRAADADREHAVALLREHAAVGRLTLEEFADRMTAAFGARTTAELAELTRDLPATGEAVASRRKPTRFVLALFGSSERDGRIRVRRYVGCLMGFGNIDLDLRQATFEREVITVFALGALGAIDVYVPEGVEVDLHAFAIGGHKRARGNDLQPLAGTPLVRIVAVSIFAGIDVWRVPAGWAQKTRREIIRGIQKGAHRELETGAPRPTPSEPPQTG